MQRLPADRRLPLGPGPVLNVSISVSIFHYTSDVYGGNDDNQWRFQQLTVANLKPKHFMSVFRKYLSYWNVDVRIVPGVISGTSRLILRFLMFTDKAVSPPDGLASPIMH